MRKFTFLLIFAAFVSGTAILKAQDCDYFEDFSDPANVNGTLSAAPSNFDYLVNSDATLTFWCNAGAGGSRNATFTLNNLAGFSSKALVDFDWGVRSCRAGGGDGFVAFRDAVGQTVFALSTKNTSSNTAGQPIQVGVGPTIDTGGADVIPADQKTTLSSSVLTSGGGAVTDVDPAWFHVSVEVDMAARTVTFTLTGINGTTGTATATVPLTAGFALNGGINDIQMGVSRPTSNSPWWGTKLTNLCIKNEDPEALPPTIALTSGSSSQTVTAGDALENIVYTWGGGATEANVVWTDGTSPDGITVTPDIDTKTVTISGAPTAAGTYAYSITSTDGTAVSDPLTGTISVEEAAVAQDCDYFEDFATAANGTITGVNGSNLSYNSTDRTLTFDLSTNSTGSRKSTYALATDGVDFAAKAAVDFDYYTTSAYGGGATDPGFILSFRDASNIALFSVYTKRASASGATTTFGVAAGPLDANDYATTLPAEQIADMDFTIPSGNTNGVWFNIKAEADLIAGNITFTVTGINGTTFSNTVTLALPSGYSITNGIKVIAFQSFRSSGNIYGVFKLTNLCIKNEDPEVLPPTIALTSGSSSQTVTAGDAVENIVYTWGGGATEANVVWTDGTAPDGITVTPDIDTKTVTISGAPTTAGTYAYSITSTDGTAESDPLTGTITVVAEPSTITLTSGSDNQEITTGDAIANIVYTWGGGATEANVVWTPAGTPAGIAVTKDVDTKTVTISGTPAASGIYKYSITSTDGTAVSSALTGTITVTAPLVTDNCDYFEDFATGIQGVIPAASQVLAYNSADHALKFDISGGASGGRIGTYTLANGGIDFAAKAAVNFDYYTTSVFGGTDWGFIVSFRDASDITLFSVYTNRASASGSATTFGVAAGPLDASGYPVAEQKSDLEFTIPAGTGTGNWFNIKAEADLLAKTITFTVTGITDPTFSDVVTLNLPSDYTLDGGIRNIVFQAFRSSGSTIYGIVELTNLCIKEVPAPPTIALTSGSSSQTVTAGDAVENIVYTWGGGATEANVVWTPAGTPAGIDVTTNAAAKTVKISGTPTAIGTYDYSITATDGTAVSDALTGTITVDEKVGFNGVNPDDKVVGIHYYDLQGVEIFQPVDKGVYIVKKIFENKEPEISKILYKK